MSEVRSSVIESLISSGLASSHLQHIFSKF